MPTPLTIGTGRAVLTPRGARPLVRETFTDTNGTALASHTPEVGGAWTDHGGGLRITGNALSVASSGVGSIEAGRANVTIAANITAATIGSNDNVALLSRFVDGSNYWALLAILGGASSNTVNIYEVVAGAFTLRASVAFTFAAGVVYALQLVDSGAGLAGTINGGTPVSFPTTANNTTTRKGVRLFNPGTANEMRMNDILITG